MMTNRNSIVNRMEKKESKMKKNLVLYLFILSQLSNGCLLKT